MNFTNGEMTRVYMTGEIEDKNPSSQFDPMENWHYLVIDSGTLVLGLTFVEFCIGCNIRCGSGVIATVAVVGTISIEQCMT